ncbi:MAG: UDP-N-acetylmuramoyl-tripeptide--D-alanyl-D-alanine ligase, partial [Candidatus Limnocylindrales bacterium]
AAVAEIEREAAAHGGAPAIVLVPDGLAALQHAAAAWRGRFQPVVVGVTGSLAKTSTKEAIAETLAGRWTVLRNEGNENNEVGLPLTLLRLGPEHEVAVLEMGMYVPGEIATLAALAHPTIGVVTAVRGTHLSRAGSIEAIERGKGELVEALPASGTAVLNADDPRVAGMAARTRARVVSYGFASAADVRAEAVTSLGTEGMRFRLVIGTDRMEATTPALGRHSVHNALCGAAVATALGMGLPQIVQGIRRGLRARHRTSLIRVGDWQILDDSYNAAPDSMAAALELLASLPGRRIAVLGPMLELGPSENEAHRAVGRQAAAAAEIVVTVGEGARGIAEGAWMAAGGSGSVHPAADRSEALAILRRELRPADVVLIKASRGAGLDWIVDELVGAEGGSTS